MQLRKRSFQLILGAFGAFMATSGAAQFTDAFDDGDFSMNPTWSGNVSLFQINAGQELQLNALAAGESYLQSDHTMTTLDNQEWRFWIKQGFSPSSSNNGRVYLVSDQTDLTGSLNGYFVQFGEAGSADAVELFEQTGTLETSIARGTDGQIASSFEVGVRVTRDAAGTWSLFVNPAGGTNYSFQGSGVNTTHNSSAHMGVGCLYTVSNVNNFYFDDFYAGPMVVDIDPPTISSVSVIDVDHIDVFFNEAVEQITAETLGNYDVQPFLSATNAVRDPID